jgi:dolichol kinase
MLSTIAGNDPVLVGVSFLWIVLVIAAGELARRAAGQPPDLTRKIVHVGVGFWALPTALLFDSPWWAVLCPAVFIVLNALSYRLRLMEVIEEEGRGSPGTIYFPVAFVALILVFWPLGARAAMVAGLFAMAFGDAAASVVGRRWGRRRYRAAGGTKSWEGTAAMFGVSFAAILPGTWVLLAGPAWIPSLGAAAAAAAAEAPAGRGLDNLTVPAAAGFVFWALAGTGA